MEQSAFPTREAMDSNMVDGVHTGVQYARANTRFAKKQDPGRHDVGAASGLHSEALQPLVLLKHWLHVC